MKDFGFAIVRFIVSVLRGVFNQSMTVVITADLKSLSPMISEPCLKRMVEKFQDGLVAETIVVMVESSPKNLPIVLFCRDELGVYCIRHDGSRESFKLCIRKIHARTHTRYIAVVPCPSRYELQHQLLLSGTQLRRQLKAEAVEYAS